MAFSAEHDERLRDLQRQIARLTETMSLVSGETECRTFGDFAQEYMAQKLRKPTLRIATKRAFQIQILKHLIPAFGALPLGEITNDVFLRWVVSAKERGELTRFFNARKCLVEVLNAAKEAGHIQKVPSLDNPDERRDVGRVLGVGEVLRILRHLKERAFRFFFYVLWKMGCRPREVARWEWDMIKWGEPGKTWIDIPARISKTARTRTIPINPSVSRRLFAQWKSRPDSNFVFPCHKDPTRPQLSYNGAWNTACKHAGVKKAVPYDLRRTFITKAAANGMPLIYVAKALDTSTGMIEGTYAKAQADVMERIVS